jgi:acetyl-CoA C-acetyltransferase
MSPVIVGFARTPFGSFLGKLSALTAPELGVMAVRGALKSAGIQAKDIELTIMGQVLSAGSGQNPARQVSIKSGIPEDRDAYSVNKVCASGMKAVSLGCLEIAAGKKLIVAGGMESMSNAPFIQKELRKVTVKFGDAQLQDSLLHDGLTCAFAGIPMGNCAEKVNKQMGISREDQDLYCLESYRRSNRAWSSGNFLKNEVIKMPGLERDEELGNLKLEKVASLKPSFSKEDGTITAANASKLSDGAAALILASEDYAKKERLHVRARILASADFACNPIDFTLAPAGAIKKALAIAKLKKSEIDFWEINEAFSSVVLANVRMLDLDLARVNVDGGAISIGHPIGASGARITATLVRILESRDARFGVAAVCNGGGGATAIVVERILE